MQWEKSLKCQMSDRNARRYPAQSIIRWRFCFLNVARRSYNDQIEQLLQRREFWCFIKHPLLPRAPYTDISVVRLDVYVHELDPLEMLINLPAPHLHLILSTERKNGHQMGGVCICNPLEPRKLVMDITKSPGSSFQLSTPVYEVWATCIYSSTFLFNTFCTRSHCYI